MNRPNEWEEETHERRTTATVAVLFVLLVCLVAAFGSCGLLNESDYLEQHTQAQAEMKESGAWVMW